MCINLLQQKNKFAAIKILTSYTIRQLKKYEMKKTMLTLFVVLLSFSAFAQAYDVSVYQRNKASTKHLDSTKRRIQRPSHCPSSYISLGTGINNNTGLLGVSFDVPIVRYASIEGGAGISSWGYKIAISGKYYLDACHRGWAFGGGVTYNTGLKNYQQNLETVTGNVEQVSLTLNPQTNAFLAVHRYWNLGKQYNRIYLELGYSVPLSYGNKYTQISGYPLSDNSKTTMNLISPGGLIIGFGFSFGIN